MKLARHRCVTVTRPRTIPSNPSTRLSPPPSPSAGCRAKIGGDCNIQALRSTPAKGRARETPRWPVHLSNPQVIGSYPVPRVYTLRSSDLWRDSLPRKPSQQTTKNLATFIATTDKQTTEYLQIPWGGVRSGSFGGLRNRVACVAGLMVLHVLRLLSATAISHGTNKR